MRLIACVRKKFFNFISSFFFLGFVGSIVKDEKERKSKAETKSRPKINISKYAERWDETPKIMFSFSIHFCEEEKRKNRYN